MHYFIEHNYLSTQAVADAFGPSSGSPTTDFNITSKFQLSQAAKAFACQSGQMIIQQSDLDSSLVNVILKPIAGTKVGDTAVKYFIYRGLEKADFISGSAIAASGGSSTEFIDRFWNKWSDYKTAINNMSEPDPGPHVIGYDVSLVGTKDVEDVYNNSENTKSTFVKEGEWFGNFTAQGSFKIGMDIVLESNSASVDFADVRLGSKTHSVQSLSGIELRAERDKVLNYMDPAAFFGMHYEQSVDMSTYSGATKSTVPRTGQSIYTDLVSPFATKNRVYVDVRNERGYSYNFYGNYVSGVDNLKLGNSSTTPAAQPYSQNSWPLLFIDSGLTTASTKNNVKLNLRVDDNLKPLVHFANPAVVDNGDASGVLRDDVVLNGTSTTWTNDLDFYFPNTGAGATKSNVANYVKINYFRQAHNPSSPNTVQTNENYFDSTFCPINLSGLGSTSDPLGFRKQAGTKSVFGTLLTETTGFDQLTESTVSWDDNYVLFSNRATSIVTPTENVLEGFDRDHGESYGFTLNTSFNKKSPERNALYLSNRTIQEDIGGGNYASVRTLGIAASNFGLNRSGSIVSLGITQTELATLQGVSGLSAFHDKNIYLDEVSGSPFSDIDSVSFRKYKLKVQGQDSSGNELISAPGTDVFVYTEDGDTFASTGFTSGMVDATVNYKKNQEERIGSKNNHWDTYIGMDTGTGSMDSIVSSFISGIAAVSATSSTAKSQILNLVIYKGQDLFDRAVWYVQNEMTQTTPEPDDRPLFWARTKMGFHLKDHDFFKSSLFSTGKIRPNSELDRMLQFFEESTRNYCNVSFSTAETNGHEKLLVTGFDPFSLDDNEKQSNPSGAMALALHGRTLTRGGKTVAIECMMIPVRYADFDKRIVERYVAPFIGGGTGEADMIITISQSGSGRFHIDRFGTMYRNHKLDDNLGEVRPTGPWGTLTSAESSLHFIESTLPKKMSQVTGETGDPAPDAWDHFTVWAQYYKPVTGTSLIPQSPKFDLIWDATNNYLKPGTSNVSLTRSTLHAGPFPRMKEGSGGDYLSNEIFYRVGLERERWMTANSAPKFPTGHFHVSWVQISYRMTATGPVKHKRDMSDTYAAFDYQYVLHNSNRNVYAELTESIKTVEDRIKRGIEAYNGVGDLY